MRSSRRTPRTLLLGAALVSGFLLGPLALIALYAFSADDRTYLFPPTGLTTRWLGVTLGRPDVWAALKLSLVVACGATALALVLGTMAALAVARGRFHGRDAITLLLVLPIALPGIVTGIALLSAIRTAQVEPGVLTIVVAHATFYLVAVYNNASARLRRLPPSLIEASLDLGADGLQTFRYVVLPNLATALLAGGLLAFALSFDEVIVTTSTAGHEVTLPIWFLSELFRPRDRPVTNVVALIVMVVTFVPMLAAYLMTRDPSAGEGAGK